jgi:voltage-gated potassium channel Kch
MIGRGSRTLARVAGRHLLALFALVGIAAYVLGVIGMRAYLGSLQAQHPPAGALTWPNALYFAATLFVADSTPFQNFGRYPAALEVARFLAPFATSLGLAQAVAALFAGQVTAWRARRCVDHVVVCGAMPAAAIVAARTREEGSRVVLVTDRTGDEAETSPAAGILAIPGDPGDPATLRAAAVGRAARLVICSDHGLGGISVAAVARDLARDARAARRRPVARASRWSGRDRPLECFAQAGDVDFVVPVQVRAAVVAPDPAFTLTFFSLEAVGARILAGRDVPAFDGDHPPEVVVIGATDFGRALIVELARAWRSWHARVAGPLPVVLVAPGATAVADGLNDRYHAVRTFLTLRAADGPPSPGLTAGAGRVYVCDEDSDPSLTVALNVARAAQARPDDVGGRTVVTLLLGRMEDPGRATRALYGSGGVLDDAGGRLRFFALYDEACRPREIYDETYVRMATAIHDNYIHDRLDEGHPLGSLPALRLWDELAETFRQSNIAQARGYAAALGRLGYVVVPTEDEPVPVTFTDAEVEQLARAEHDRWMADTLARGYRYGPVRDDGPDPRHPNLVDWDDLPDPVRDRDRQPMRRMPAVLALVDLQIVRRPPG